ncbi:TlpA family protein disulfide reductase [Lentisalinibacter sediminis]|uniref:TlpA family protein disulfide reductase n=1 Tax=Lentisalinibacter sediminis TaxID=2992237 RepID=UPI003864D41D
MKAICTSLALTILLATSSLGAREAAPPLPQGANAPAWTLPSPSGEPVEFPADADSRPAVVLFWATWCPWCKALMPHLQSIREDYADWDVQVFAVSVWDDGDPVGFIARNHYDFVPALQGNEIAYGYGVTGTPGLFVIDGEGKVAMNRFLIDLTEFVSPPPGRDSLPPAQSAEAWADLVRETLDGLLAE